MTASPTSGYIDGSPTAERRQFSCRSAHQVARPRLLDSDGDAERDARTDADWFEAVVAYLEFRAGSAWRRSRLSRQSPRYNEYLAPLRLMAERRYQADHPCNCSAHCLPQFGFRRRLEPVHPQLYPGDRFFQLNPHYEALTDANGRYVGYRRRLPRWIDRPEVHLPSCRCPRHRTTAGKSQSQLQIGATA